MYTIVYLCQETGKERLGINWKGKEVAFCER
jgi:hypothetical protein